MQSIQVRNVNHALPLALALLRDTGKPVAPRGQPTLEIEGPFATTYENPLEMVLFDPQRDANVFFHFFEALWVLQGREDVGFLAWFLPRMADYSDDGKVFHAPYGYRMRHGFGFDQIEAAISKLSNDNDTRQAVLSIWHPELDLGASSRDLPCNDMVMFKIRDGKLRMTVCNRSNDAVLGAYGANVVQFSTLQRYVAGRVGVAIGAYTQVSDSFHVYQSNPYWQQWSAQHTAGVPPVDDLYDQVGINPNGYMSSEELKNGWFDKDLQFFFETWDESVAVTATNWTDLLEHRNYGSSSFVDVVLPMLYTLRNWRSGRTDLALETAKHIRATDWRLAAEMWMQRRIDKKAVSA